ncbi:putative membrane protein [Golovinomyces cichoracearum]|uniref:Putative membrane protein n=1 Tax=Golovinomyces cichoracearum TaxID=62708 RepID=A0A420IWJ4_9PEZI|nr:putative membrane protein [Golovinomyces cichoracearum]
MTTNPSEKKIFVAKIIATIAATFVSLACGTNYVYSAWGPQFADKLRFSTTEQNLIGISANLGMYLLGIPIGIFVDAKGARATVLYGGVLLGIGYSMLYNAHKTGSGYFPLLCLYSFFTGVGGCASFAAAVKISVLNWPSCKGTATAFPVAAFGLSAFFFSFFGRLYVAEDTSGFLLLLAIGTSGLVFSGFFFVRVIDQPKVRVGTRKHLDIDQIHASGPNDSEQEQTYLSEDVEAGEAVTAESAPLILNHLSLTHEDRNEISSQDHSELVPTRGFQLLFRLEFWQLFALMGILAGIALMTINNTGNNVGALWRKWDKKTSEKFIIQQETVQVSIISICSFLGRIMSGIGSDILVKVLKVSRLWCLALASIVYFVAQLCAIFIQNPNFLFLISAPTGLAYGFLFGCIPSLVSETFGIDSLSQNYGAMTLSPIFSGNLFNLFYGTTYDHHSELTPDGHRVCLEGLSCYRKAYYLTASASIIGLVVSLWSISYSHRVRKNLGI